jgi:hypothetical protein
LVGRRLRTKSKFAKRHGAISRYDFIIEADTICKNAETGKEAELWFSKPGSLGETVGLLLPNASSLSASNLFENS